MSSAKVRETSDVSKKSNETQSVPTKGKNITWDELNKHNVSTDCWLAVRGKVYDVTSWVSKHPGGEDPLVLNGGRDATQLFEAYHPTKVYQYLTKYYVGEIKADEEHPAFPPMSDFYLNLKKKIEDYFATKKMSPRYAPEMLVRSFLLVTAAFMLHYYAIFAPNLLTSLILACMLGFVTALICFMPVHEGSHASTTENPLVWRLLGATHDWVNGASYYTWLHQHFLGHHPYTNVTNSNQELDSFDPDTCTHNPDLRRIKPQQPWLSHYRFQQIYMPLLYGLLGIKYRINDITIVYFAKANGKIKMNPLNSWHSFNFVAGKCFWFFYRFVLPSFYIPVWKVVLIWAVSDLVLSYILAFVFQVNHIIPQAKWPKIDKETGIVNMDWAEMQIATTMDYAHGDWWTTFFTGALNYQVTHHLFPYISQVHYIDIAPIIVQHCKENGITYHVLPSFWAAFKNHIKYLHIMGYEHSEF